MLLTACRVLLALALTFTLTMAWLPHPPHTPLEHFDKLQHMAAFATLAILAAFAFPSARLVLIGERLSFLGALVEVVQAMPAIHRDCDIKDWIADTIAIVIVLMIMATARRRRWVGPALAPAE